MCITEVTINEKGIRRLGKIDILNTSIDATFLNSVDKLHGQ